MSERMIELRRAQMSQSPGKGNLHHTPLATGVVAGNHSQQQTPQQAAAAQSLSEDAQIQRFIHRLQRRDDSHPTSDSFSGPTVPTALSRRVLQRQGVGYLDDTVASAISASADRFLATILQQAIVCRDQRLNGAEMARNAARQRKRHIQHYNADRDDRKRRRGELEEAREKKQLKLIAAAETANKQHHSSSADATPKSPEEKKKKKKKKVDPVETAGATNGVTPSNETVDLDEDDDDESYDSIDEEEEYYQEKIGDVRVPLKGDDEEEDDTLLLRDLVRPLEAWDFHLTGKEALEDHDSDSDEEDLEGEDEEKVENSAPTESGDGGSEFGLDFDGMDGAKGEGTNGDDGGGGAGDVEAKKKAETPAAPKASS